MALERTVPRVRGTGRTSDNPKAIILYFDVVLSDDQMRALHDEINEFVAMRGSSEPSITN